jgi:hypothetical protein
MSFKMKPPYEIDNTPVYFVDEEPGVLGRANMCGSITVNKNVRDPKQLEEIISHEKVHVDQIKEGKLAYDDNYIYHRKSGKGSWKKIKRSEKADGDKSTWFEKEAYKKEKK